MLQAMDSQQFCCALPMICCQKKKKNIFWLHGCVCAVFWVSVLILPGMSGLPLVAMGCQSDPAPGSDLEGRAADQQDLTQWDPRIGLRH